MSKKEFLSKLKVKLTKYEDKGVEKVIQFYTEILDDKLELGMTEREAVDSLGDMDDIVESLVADLIERPDKTPQKQKESPKEFYDEPLTAYIKHDEPRERALKEKVGYDVFHDPDLLGKKGYKLNKALNKRFDCDYRFVIYSVLHYLAIVAKVFCGIYTAISVGATGVGGIMTCVRYGDKFGKIMFYGGTALFVSAVLAILGIFFFKIIDKVQEVFHGIMRKTIDKKIAEVNYENKH